MMGLTDRVEPWARRFQRAAPRSPAPVRDPASPSTTAPAAGETRPAVPPQRRTGRFTRRVLQER